MSAIWQRLRVALSVVALALVFVIAPANAGLTVPPDVRQPSGFPLKRVDVSSAYTAHAGELVGVSTSVGAITVSLPASPILGSFVAVGDADGSAATNAITVSGNGVQIDGASTYQIATASSIWGFLYDGNSWKRQIQERTVFDATIGQYVVSRPAAALGGGGGAFTLDANGSIKSAATDAAPIGVGTIGAFSSGHDDGSIASIGVTGNYAAAVGGMMPSIDGDYAGGGGYRPNARAVGAWAFGYSAFADGEGSFAGGRSTVASYLAWAQTPGNITFAVTGASTGTLTRSSGSWVTDGFFVGAWADNFKAANAANKFRDATITGVTVTVLSVTLASGNLTPEVYAADSSTTRYTTKYGAAFGRANQARAEGALSWGRDSLVDASASYGVAGGQNSSVGPAAKWAVAIGNQCQGNGPGAVAIGEACIVGTNVEAGVALGYHNTIAAGGDCGVALGQSCTVSGNSAFASGRLSQAQSPRSHAMGEQCVASNTNAFAINNQTTASGENSLASGYGSTASRSGERVHGFFGSNDGAFHELGLTTALNAAGTDQLKDQNGQQITFPNGKMIWLRLTVTASRTDAAGRGRKTFDISAHTSGGVLVIDDGVAAPIKDNFPAGVTLAVTPSGADTVLPVAVTTAGAGNWRFKAFAQWIEDAGN